MKVLKFLHNYDGLEFGIIDAEFKKTSFAETYDKYGNLQGEEFRGLTAVSHEFFDGTKWQSIVLENDMCPTGLIDVTNTEEGKAIIAAYEKLDKDTTEMLEIKYQDGFNFYISKWASNPYLARVE